MLLKKLNLEPRKKQNKFQFYVVNMEPENTNSVLVTDGKNCVIFDSWGVPADWKKLLDDNGWNLVAIYSTHGHPDHISAAPGLVRLYNIDWFLHPNDKSLIGWGNDLLNQFGIDSLSSNDDVSRALPVERLEILDDLFVSVIELPGHTMGGVGYLFDDFNLFVVGDTIFKNGVGRFDLVGGNVGELKKSISKIYNLGLADDVFVVFGHGDCCNFYELKRENNY
ncbi:MAG: MBL fold metallo-hydrolase, partial [Alphaproteobacteria bacterium]